MKDGKDEKGRKGTEGLQKLTFVELILVFSALCSSVLQDRKRSW